MPQRILASTMFCLATMTVTGSGLGQTSDIRLALWEPAITVNGTGEVEHVPDMAEIHVGVVTQAESAAEAVDRNSQRMGRLIQTLREQGIAERDIQTSTFQITPQREHPDPQRRQRPPRIIGYEVTNQVRITVRQLRRLGVVLDMAVEQGANQIHGIEFSISDRSQQVDEALRRAVADARRKAESLAEEADLQVGRVLRIEEHVRDEPPRPMMARAMAQEAAVPIAPGTLTVRADVSVAYRIGEERQPREDQAVAR